LPDKPGTRDQAEGSREGKGGTKAAQEDEKPHPNGPGRHTGKGRGNPAPERAKAGNRRTEKDEARWRTARKATGELTHVTPAICQDRAWPRRKWLPGAAELPV
jgi:hypothetical protein